MPYSVTQSVEHGIERIVYTPDVRRFATPIILQHGMWHGAWCWQPWQALLAEWGWETHAHSLPGHGGSPVQRPIRWCTLQYYYEFLNTEVRRQPVRPVLLGHSMGGALCHWWLKYGPPLPAMVMLAPWNHADMVGSLGFTSRIDPWGALLGTITLSATPAIRTPQLAFDWFCTAGALLSPEELHARLGPESGLVLLQYSRDFGWTPAPRAHSPLMIVAGGADYCLPPRFVRPAAEHYGCEYVEVAGAGHDLMLERSYAETAQTIHAWLASRVV